MQGGLKATLHFCSAGADMTSSRRLCPRFIGHEIPGIGVWGDGNKSKKLRKLLKHGAKQAVDKPVENVDN